MGYRSLQACAEDLERNGHLKRIDHEVDPRLEAAEIHRRVYEAGGPALLFTRVRGTRFPMLSNLFGTIERARFVFRDSLAGVSAIMALRADPAAVLRAPWRALGVPFTALHMLPMRSRGGPVFQHETTLSALPQLVCWPRDGGAFITLPQVYSEDPDRPGPTHGNLGMYRIQLSGNAYVPEREVGLHYQIHRGIGVHHSAALRRGERLPVRVFVGGSPAMSLAAVMPLPEGLSELMFAGALNRRRVRMAELPGGAPGQPRVHAEADFCLVGSIDPTRSKLEGPFGDHLGYYSLAHDFPVLEVDKVYHRSGAIWPFTVVGRPPQEDTVFGALIHELTSPVVPALVPGVLAVHAVDAAGVHPLLLALGSERYTPYEPLRRPQELLTQANAILGQGQMSLAKYLVIANAADDPALDIHDIAAVFAHVLRRIDPRRDLHFQTETTIDTLDYSAGKLNQGSKLVLAAAGPALRELPTAVPAGLSLPGGFGAAALCMPGVLAVRGPAYAADVQGDDAAIARFCSELAPSHALNAFPLVIVCDDSVACARSLRDFVWMTFTRSDPARDVHGIGSFTRHKHWGCEGSIVIDARIKPWHAPPLDPDPDVSKRVDALCAKGGPLHGLV
jgi:4-hydroxy-3-polyprenylbenzoate decarboxylase